MLKIILTFLSFATLHTAAHGETFFDPHIAATMVSQGEAILSDVREADEIVSGMAEPAAWLATSKIKEGAPEFHAFMATLDPEKAVIVYCGSGKRAAYFVGVLREAGFKAENMGPFSSWVEAGLPVVTPTLETATF